MFCRGGSVPPELELMRTLPAVYYVNTSPLEERVEVLLFEKKNHPDNTPNIFNKSNIDHYMEWPSATFCNG